jgi:hypothetical protein
MGLITCTTYKSLIICLTFFGILTDCQLVGSHTSNNLIALLKLGNKESTDLELLANPFSFINCSRDPAFILLSLEALVEEQPGTPGNFPGLFKVAREKYLFSPAQISGQNDKNLLICPKLWFGDTVSRYGIEIRYRDTVSRYDIKIQYQDMISRYGIEIWYQDTVSRYNIEIRYRDRYRDTISRFLHMKP